MNDPLRIAIIGYGKMGREIHKYAQESGCEVSVIVDQPHDWQKYDQQIRNAEVAIEFTSPHVVIDNIKRLMDMHVPVVTGTTGWTERLPEIEQYCNSRNAGLFYASNFSIGVNLFFALNRYLADLMRAYPEYKPSLEEIHHTQKLDAPSGTAISMLNDILSINKDYKGWKFSSENPTEDEISVDALRIEGVTGTHKLTYSTPIEKISIEHVANNREGFAKGALLAARWMRDKKGIYSMNDLLKL